MKQPDHPKNGTKGKEDEPRPGQYFYCGVDVGASATKTVVINEKGEVLSRFAMKSGVDYPAAAEACRSAALAGLHLGEEEITACVSTGYGRNNVEFAQQRLTEITCHGKGCYNAFHCGMVIVDIGGQDSKVIRLDPHGRRIDFKMNRKCAAGTGAFLEEIAARLDIPLGDLDGLARGADKKFSLGSFCTVFAKTEILAYIRKGERVENIIRGAFHSVVKRIIEMDRFDEDVVLTGGVVHYNPILKDAFEEVLGKEVRVPPFPQFTGAFGAALAAKENT